MKRFRPVQFDEEAAHFVRVGEAVHQCKGIDPGRSVNVFAVVDEQGATRALALDAQLSMLSAPSRCRVRSPGWTALKTRSEMGRFFVKLHGPEPFHGILIRW